MRILPPPGDATPMADSQLECARARTSEGEAEGEVVLDPPAALIPADLLKSGEIILMVLKPSIWFVLLESLKSLVLILLATAGVAVAARMGAVWISKEDIVLAGIGASGIRLFWQFLEWLGRIYILTDQRVISVGGVLRVSVQELLFKELRDSELQYSGRERTFGLGSIFFYPIEPSDPTVRWQMLSTPVEVFERVRHLINRYR